MTTRTLVMLTLLVGCGPDPRGTEIGDEGPAMCVGEPIPMDAGSEVFGTAPDPLADGVEGIWQHSDATLTLTVDRAGFTFTDNEHPEWEDDTPPPDDWATEACFDEVWAPADWDLVLPGIAVAWVGDISFTEDGRTAGGLQATWVDNPSPPDPNDDEGGTETEPAPTQGELTVERSAEPTTFDADEMRRVDLWVRATHDGSAWDVDVTWMAETHPEGTDGHVRSLEERVWSGRMEAD